MASRILAREELSRVSPISWLENGPQSRSQPASHTGARPGRAAGHPASPPPAEIQAERERIEREAHQRGFAEGKGVGRDQAAAELQPLMERLGRSLTEVSALRSRLRKDATGDLLKLSIAIARRVLHRELTLDPESIQGLIQVALDKIESRELYRVRVHPDQESAVRNSVSRFASSSKIELLADPTLRPGDVIFETAHGNLDASIDSQLREIERGFADRLHQ